MAAAIGMAFIAAPALATGNHNNGPVVNTDKGAVRGFVKNGVQTYLGIPYAKPPVGNLRWKPPQPANHWYGTRDATQYQTPCAQVTGLGAFSGPNSIDEDCLYLNIFTTGTNNRRHRWGHHGWGHHGHHNNVKKPVIVWIHGGGNFDGAPNGSDGSKLATGGPDGEETVVVVISYRLGLLGYLSHAALDTGARNGNYGIMDIQAVLHWVKRNIKAFGGDPNNVTLGGQSAGASDTGANVISPASAGLFHRAIYQSGPTTGFPSAATALSRGTAFAAAAFCPGSNAATASCLRNLSTARVLQLQGTPNANGPYLTGPFVDGTVIPITPEQAWTSGDYNHMPILAGRVRDEGTFGMSITEYFKQPQAAITAAEYNAAVTGALAVQYPLANYSDPGAAYTRVRTDSGLCRALHAIELWGDENPTYAYQFNYYDAPYYFPKMPDFKALAAHTIDIQFLFLGWHGGFLGVNLDQTTGVPRELNAAETALSDEIVAAWTKFAKYGNPNGTGNAPWPAYTSGSPDFFSQKINGASTTLSTATYRAAHKCDYWDPLLAVNY